MVGLLLEFFSEQNILNMDFSDQEAAIETDNWFYSISDIEAGQQKFSKFTFTDDAKTGTYLVVEDFFLEWNKNTNGWEIIGHELTYISGADQSNVGKFSEFNEPIFVGGLLNNAPLILCIIFRLSGVTALCG